MSCESKRRRASLECVCLILESSMYVAAFMAYVFQSAGPDRRGWTGPEPDLKYMQLIWEVIACTGYNKLNV